MPVFRSSGSHYSIIEASAAAWWKRTSTGSEKVSITYSIVIVRSCILPSITLAQAKILKSCFIEKKIASTSQFSSSLSAYYLSAKNPSLALIDCCHLLPFLSRAILSMEEWFINHLNKKQPTPHKKYVNVRMVVIYRR